MKKISGILLLLNPLIWVAWGIYTWREITMARRDAAETSALLESYLEERLVGGDSDDLQAISFAQDLELYFNASRGEGLGIGFIVLCAIAALICFREFEKTELCKSLKVGFVRVWTWRP